MDKNLKLYSYNYALASENVENISSLQYLSTIELSIRSPICSKIVNQNYYNELNHVTSLDTFKFESSQDLELLEKLPVKPPNLKDSKVCICETFQEGSKEKLLAIPVAL